MCVQVYTTIYNLDWIVHPIKVLMRGKLFQMCAQFFVLQCTVFGRKSKHKIDVRAWHGIHFHKNNLWNILVIAETIMWISKLSKLNVFNLLGYLTNTDPSILVYKFRPKRIGFNIHRVYTTAINFSCIVPW